MTARLALLTVGQTPRPDFTALFAGDARVAPVVVGALDGLSRDAIAGMRPETGGYPILCRLADGTTVLVERAGLAARLQELLDRPPAGGADAAMVLCTAEFPELRAGCPLVIPGRTVPALVGSLGFGPVIGVVTSNPGQIAAARRKWRAAGFRATVVSDDPTLGYGFRDVAADLRGLGLPLVVLDCFGHDESTRAAMAKVLDVPILITRTLMAPIATHAALMRPRPVAA